MKLKTLKDIPVIRWKKILLRSELNVPIDQNGNITDDTRIRTSIPTIEYLSNHWWKVIICAHLWRPKWRIDKAYSLAPILNRLSELLWKKVLFSQNLTWPNVKKMITNLKAWDILLLENIRFSPLEEICDKDFSRDLANLADFFVSDAFGVIHRKHASTYWVWKHLPSYAWLLIENEVSKLWQVLISPEKPVLAMIAWSKIETKVAIIENFLKIANKVIVWWAIANTLLKAKWIWIWSSLYQDAELPLARMLIQKWWSKLVLPVDWVLSKLISNTVTTRIDNFNWNNIYEDERILDIWPETIKLYWEIINSSKTIVWNWPVWVYEYTPFERWTRAMFEFAKNSNWKVIIWWWDTIDAMHKFWFKEGDFYHVSTWWGAALEFLEWKNLPWIEILYE